MKTLLVTGGAGFIGSHFVKHILEKYNDYCVINVDKLTYAGNLDNIKEIMTLSNHKFYKGDISDESFIKDLFKKHEIDIVVNFAAESHVDNSIKSSGLFLKTNVIGTQVLLDSAKNSWQIGKTDMGEPLFKKDCLFIQISTDEVYGSNPNSEVFTETSKLEPSNPYSASKASADLLALSFYNTYKFPVIITRSSNNFGTHQHVEKLIPLMITNALKGYKLPVYGDGMQSRDWLSVKDNVRAIDKIIHHGNIGEIYNICCQEEIINLRLIEKIISLIPNCNARMEFVNDRLGHDTCYTMSSDKLRSELGWEPKYRLFSELDKLIDWYKS